MQQLLFFLCLILLLNVSVESPTMINISGESTMNLSLAISSPTILNLALSSPAMLNLSFSAPAAILNLSVSIPTRELDVSPMEPLNSSLTIPETMHWSNDITTVAEQMMAMEPLNSSLSILEHWSNDMTTVAEQMMTMEPLNSSLSSAEILHWNKEITTVAERMMAMEALNSSLGIPERMHWNNDPCVPTSWEGVKCKPNPLVSGLVIVEIDLSSQGLTGFIAEEIRLLTNLTLLNLSNNNLTGPIPTDVYLIRLRDGTLNFTGNNGLCGVGLPDHRQCSLFSMLGGTTKAFTVGMVATIGWFVFLPSLRHDQHNPVHAISFAQGKFRMIAAASYTVFHYLRLGVIEHLVTAPRFDIRIARYIWCFGAISGLLRRLAFGCLINGTFLAWFRYTTSAHLSVVITIFLVSISYSATAMQRVIEHPWLIIIEMVWIIRSYVFLSFFVKLPANADLRVWFLHVRVLVLTTIQSLKWYEYMAITIFVYKMITMINFTMTL